MNEEAENLAEEIKKILKDLQIKHQKSITNQIVRMIHEFQIEKELKAQGKSYKYEVFKQALQILINWNIIFENKNSEYWFIPNSEDIEEWADSITRQYLILLDIAGKTNNLQGAVKNLAPEICKKIRLPQEVFDGYVSKNLIDKVASDYTHVEDIVLKNIYVKNHIPNLVDYLIQCEEFKSKRIYPSFILGAEDEEMVKLAVAFFSNNN